jgi:hypothetical protein
MARHSPIQPIHHAFDFDRWRLDCDILSCRQCERVFPAVPEYRESPIAWRILNLGTPTTPLLNSGSGKNLTTSSPTRGAPVFAVRSPSVNPPGVANRAATRFFNALERGEWGWQRAIQVSLAGSGARTHAGKRKQR